MMRSESIRRFAAALLTVLFALSALFTCAAAYAAPVPTVPADRFTTDAKEAHTGFIEPEEAKTGDIADVKAAPPLDADFSMIRVLISTGSVSSVELELCAEYTLDNGMVISGSESSPVRVTAEAGSSGVTITDQDTGEVLASSASPELTRTNVHYTAGYLKLVTSGNSNTLGRMYQGNFRFFSNGGVLKMVNHVQMTYYIYGITGYELSNSCPAESLKAQAIAAKSYGLYYVNSHADYDLQDGWTSSLYQAYRGFNMSRIATMPICYSVIGEALSCNGTFKPIYYGHSNGGETALPSIVFGSGLPIVDEGYAAVLDDIEFEYTPNSSELINVEFGGTGDSSRFLDFILCKVRDIYGVEAVSVVSIDELSAYDPIEGTQRNMQKLHVGATLLVPIVPEPTETPAPTEEPIPTDEPSPTGEPSPTEEPSPTDKPAPTDEPTIEYEEVYFTFDCPVKQLRTYVLTDMDGSGDSYSNYKYVFKKNYLIYWGRETENGYTLIFAGWGHGIGLSQTGAIVLAANHGWDYRQILAFYYPGFELISITESDPEATGGSTAAYDVLAYAVCRNDGAAFRGGGSIDYPVTATVGLNEHLDILGVTDTCWYRVVRAGHEGYMYFDDVRITRFPSPANGVFTLVDGATNCSANLRAEPGIRSGNVITYLPSGTQLTGWTHIGKWYYVTTANGFEGFISSVVVNFSEPYEYTGSASLAVRDLMSTLWHITPIDGGKKRPGKIPRE